MSAVVFDTPILSRKLAAAGMPVDQAQGVAAALAETLGEQIATRRDLDDLRRDLQRDIKDVEQRLETRIRELELSVRAEIRQSEQRQTIRLGTMLAMGIAIVAALVNLL